MAPNSCSFENFENLHFNPFHNESFSDTEDERDPDENFFNELHTQNVRMFKTSNVLIFSQMRLKVFFLGKKILKLLMQSI